MLIHSWLLREPVHSRGIWIKQGNLGIARPFLVTLGSQGQLSMENRFWKSCDILKLSQPFLKSRVTAVLLFRVMIAVCYVLPCKVKSACPGQDCLNLGSHETFAVAVTIFSVCSLSTLERDKEGLYWGIPVMPVGSQILGSHLFWDEEEDQYPVAFNQGGSAGGQFFTCSWFKLRGRN